MAFTQRLAIGDRNLNRIQSKPLLIGDVCHTHTSAVVKFTSPEQLTEAHVMKLKVNGRGDVGEMKKVTGSHYVYATGASVMEELGKWVKMGIVGDAAARS